MFFAETFSKRIFSKICCLLTRTFRSKATSELIKTHYYAGKKEQLFRDYLLSLVPSTLSTLWCLQVYPNVFASIYFLQQCLYVILIDFLCIYFLQECLHIKPLTFNYIYFLWLRLSIILTKSLSFRYFLFVSFIQNQYLTLPCLNI